MDKIDILGRTGEKIVANYLRSLGRMVVESIDHFDNQKDFLVDGAKVEVKTEQPYVMKNCFSFRENQLRKCQFVDMLYIVSVPPLIDVNYKWGGMIFEVDNNNSSFQFFSYVTKSKLNMIGIPIDQPAINPVYNLSLEEKQMLIKYATSAYGKKS